MQSLDWQMTVIRFMERVENNDIDVLEAATVLEHIDMTDNQRGWINRAIGKKSTSKERMNLAFTMKAAHKAQGLDGIRSILKPTYSP